MPGPSSNDNVMDVEPDGSGAADKHMTHPSAHAVDDFGLPIRRFPTPEKAEPAERGAIERDTGTEVDDAIENTGPDERNQRPAEERNGTKPAGESAEGQAASSDSDSDDGDFKDAQSLPSSDVGSALPANADAPEEPPTPNDRPSAKQSSNTPEALDSVNSKTPKAVKPTTTDPATTEIANVELNGEKVAENEEAEQPNSSTAKSPGATNTAHIRQTSTASTGKGDSVSGFSHHQQNPQDESQGDDELGWQEMPSYARYDMYDDDDRLIAREHNEEDDEAYGYSGLGGAGKGYTRVIMDDDAQSATSLDENTQYLFKDPNSTSMAGEDDDARDAVSQMQATKDLLTEGQRIAYVGVARLEIAIMVKEGEDLEITKKTKKETTVATEALRMWGQKMMIRLYAHMDISEAEQVMIEQLAEHGVVPQDLTPALLANARVQNPMAKDPTTPSSEAQIASSSPPPYLAEEAAAEVPPPYETREGEEMPEVKTPSQLPTTEKIDIDLRWTVLCDLFLVLIADSVYDARSRVLLERVGKSLDITWVDICRFEKRVTDALEMQQAAEKENWNEDEHMEARRKMAKTRRYVMMGLATVGGGLVIGLSAGLLAPVIGAGLAAGFTTIGVTGTSSFLAGAGGAAIITSSAAASGSFIGVKAANRRTGAVKTFEYRPLHNNKRVNLIVTVSGWLTGKVDDVRLPFSTVDPIMGDLYSVLWEPEMLRSMGDTINILATEALTQGLQQVLGSTILMGLMAALQLPIVLTKLSYLIDNPWAVSLDRAVSAGEILADSLIERSLGTRPITLVGYSLGARVVFSCLKELAKKGAYGLIQDVYLFGSPVVVRKEEYLRIRTVVSGRFVNGYNRNDWILGYLFRLTNGGIRRIAGLAAIEDCPWIENIDVTEEVPGHMEYRTAMPTLLMKCGWMVESEEFTEIEDPDPDNHKERQRELINEIEEARKELEREGKASKGSKFSIFSRRKKMERQEWEVYEDSAGKERPKSGDNDDGKEGNNHGVLFDIDAIRAELAREAQDGSTEEVQIREIQSTLPPMKLDVSPLATPPPSTHQPTSRGSLRESRSSEAIGVRNSYEYRISREPTPTPSRSALPSPLPASSAYAPPPAEDEVQMTFDTSFDDTRRPPPPPKEDGSNRPDMRTSQTLPNITLTDPWADPDDEDFGKEKDISMTFA